MDNTEYTYNIQEIVKFCIFHYNDSSTNTFLGYIGNPIVIRQDDGNISFNCAESTVFKNWKLGGTFYAISPMFRPIPNGMKLYCAKKKGGFPYNTVSNEIVYDPYNVKENCNYYITYNKKVPNTEPLYIHKIGDNIYPSFNPNPPSKSPYWTQEESSPIYVMTQKSLGGLTDINKFKFVCINNKTIPYVNSKDLENVFDVKNIKPMKFSESVILCDFMTVNLETKQQDLLDQISIFNKPWS